MLTTFTVFSTPPGAGWWALRQMSSARRTLRSAAGLRFWRLLGAGRRFGGVAPDLRRYALLGVWDDEAAAQTFLRDAADCARAGAHPGRQTTSFLRTLAAAGAWDGERPFGAPTVGPAAGPVAVLTRATVRPWRQLAFLRQARSVEHALRGASGLRFALPVGELPLRRSGTFTIWDDAEAVARFVRCPAHRIAMTARREQGWYREELFARFAVVRSEEVAP